ncbi:MAG: flotillin-like FloA family protein, partial [Pirellulaceae bacterium]
MTCPLLATWSALLGQFAGPPSELSLQQFWPIVLTIFLVIIAMVVAIVFYSFGSVWLQAVMSGADISMLSLIGMYFRQVRAQTIVNAKIMAAQSGLN